MRERIRWFDMESKREREKREKEYERRMFPFGEEQRKAELELLGKVIFSVKPQDALYQLLQVQEILLDESDGDGQAEQIQRWKRSLLARKLKTEELELLVRLASRILACGEMGDFPTAQELGFWEKK